MAGETMSARDEILSSIRARKLVPAPKPDTYRVTPVQGDLVEAFAKRASTQFADVRILNSMNEVPDAAADILRARNMAAEIHVPPDSPLAALDLPNTEIKSTPPEQNDAALTLAPYGIAATGTLMALPLSARDRGSSRVVDCRRIRGRARENRQASLHAQPRDRPLTDRRHRTDDGARRAWTKGPGDPDREGLNATTGIWDNWCRQRLGSRVKRPHPIRLLYTHQHAERLEDCAHIVAPSVGNVSAKGCANKFPNATRA
jgi:hypothetical protein